MQSAGDSMTMLAGSKALRQLLPPHPQFPMRSVLQGPRWEGTCMVQHSITANANLA